MGCGGGLLAAPSNGQRASTDLARETQGLLERGLYEKAEELADRRLSALTDASASPLEIAAAADILVGARLLNGKGADPATLALAVRTLRSKEGELGVSAADLLPSLLNLSDTLVAAGDYVGAVEISRRAVSLRERLGAAAIQSRRHTRIALAVR